LEHHIEQTTGFVPIYALLSRIRLNSSKEVPLAAERVIEEMWTGL
jgi:hypothetical protein